MAMTPARVEGSSHSAPASRPAPTDAPSPDWVPLLIRADHCKGCELCVLACPHGSLALDDATVNSLGYRPVRLVDPAACTSCAICARVCPDAVFVVLARPRTITGGGRGR